MSIKSFILGNLIDVWGVLNIIAGVTPNISFGLNRNISVYSMLRHGKTGCFYHTVDSDITELTKMFENEGLQIFQHRNY